MIVTQGCTQIVIQNVQHISVHSTRITKLIGGKKSQEYCIKSISIFNNGVITNLC